MQLDPTQKQKEIAVRAACQSISTAKRVLREGNEAGCASEVGSALCWAVEYWLLEHDHQPDFGNGWSSMIMQFIRHAPQELRHTVISPYASAQWLAAYGENASCPDNETLSKLEELCDRAAAVVKSLTGVL